MARTTQESERGLNVGDVRVRAGVSSAGRFHMFDLARELDRLSVLGALYTGYPRWKLNELPKHRIHTSCWPTLLTAAGQRLGWQGAWQKRWRIKHHDRWTASVMEPCDVFHCLSSFGLESHQVAKARYGALTICDRGSSHILYQSRILTEEHERWGLNFAGIDPWVIEREVAEYEFCDLICVPSSFAYRSFLERGVPEAKLRKNPYGVDLSLFRQVAKQDRAFRVICVGTLSLRKGAPYLLEALAPLNLPNFEVWLIGHILPEVRPFLKRYRDRVRIWGPLPRSELYKYYSQGSVFVIASLEEGLALVQAQAMACGLPVIATTNTGAEDLFTDGVEGFIVPIREPEAIREKVMYLYEHPDVREQMAGAALERVRSLGGWNVYGRRAASLYSASIEAREEA